MKCGTAGEDAQKEADSDTGYKTKASTEQKNRKESNDNGAERINGLIRVSADKNTREQSNGCGRKKPSGKS